ncbi:ATP-binding protein [Spiractinospora alimapuensis]|uniref:ATP-binding protein n=1 Tax=Spiractinospora alimapuensis TaxID=2820884 RepID=UPI001F1834CD|nr:ATP-binding protein [Spiractinospora alimapuensis]QVQ50382.1 ATP-binding protein [Spiractinospora alimapuensis]
MDVSFSITLPRASYTVGVTRLFLRSALDSSGVVGEFRDDILSAATEACANSIDHGFPARSYQVEMRVAQDWCVIEVTDTGSYFDVHEVGMPEDDAESGRGILMMRELVDNVALDEVPGGGKRVSLLKWRVPLSAAAPAPRTPVG